MELGIDVSHWNLQLDWDLFARSGVRFVFIKATQGNYYTDPSCQKHLTGATVAGIIPALYHWCDPLVPADLQADYFYRVVEVSNCRAVALDIEQHWSDWKEWPDKVTKHIPPKQISGICCEIAARLKQKLSIPLIIYTRTSFLKEYAPSSVDWIKEYPLWLAQYPYLKGSIKTSWQDILDRWQDLQLRKNPLRSPDLPPKCARWTFWQFSGDKFILPGAKGFLDLNWFNGTQVDLYAFFSFTPPPPPAPPSTPLTVEDRLNRLERLAVSHGWSLA